MEVWRLKSEGLGLELRWVRMGSRRGYSFIRRAGGIALRRSERHGATFKLRAVRMAVWLV